MRSCQRLETDMLSSVFSEEVEPTMHKRADNPPIPPPLFSFLRNYLCWNIPSHIHTQGHIPGEEMEEREGRRFTKDSNLER